MQRSRVAKTPPRAGTKKQKARLGVRASSTRSCAVPWEAVLVRARQSKSGAKTVSSNSKFQNPGLR